MSGGSVGTSPLKYRSKPCVVHGRKFHSKKEGSRFAALVLLGRAGKIKRLLCQPRFVLKVNGKVICIYTADFQYWCCDRKKWVVEEVKGFKQRDYILRAKLFQALNPDVFFLET